ncbi:hypothetical protein SAMD00019534_116340 [Acytostelium subglobosum LB1]|uniref:hypothetical protein n=1 Tax=Acytostelium subglobosum LB1 TaxID=1410327 RepID=UPI00064520D6|nr:hypothetical protein SAMD00019534_116340 [Acytostelium subglobosum LB1]GAM28458.1 hypothetical protein SAMD00019534_116340 [Acytostelium subglobosum LB1]|eukprot:XP_012748497.1 hypothetical protein SAMD00019534_116340 [Acytostelium subglobosum LB1]
MPNEVSLRILSQLEPKDLNAVQMTSQTLHRFCQENTIWKSICKRKWSLSPVFKRRCLPSWKEYYSRKMSLLNSVNGLCWIEISASGDKPSGRYQHTSTLIGQYIYYIGGQKTAEERFDEIYRFDTVSHSFEKVELNSGPMPKFARHAAVGIDHNIYTFGGFDGFSKHYSLCMFDTIERTWNYIDCRGNLPIPRTNHAATAMDRSMYIFGGMYKNDAKELVFLNDLYRLDVDTLIWTRLFPSGDIPPPRCGHRLITLENKLLLFGGGSGPNWGRKFNDVHIYDPLMNHWTKVVVKGRVSVCTFSTCFNVGPFFFVYGGQSFHDDTLSNDLYMLDTVSMEWTRIETICAPYPRDMATGNMVGSNMYMFGGLRMDAENTILYLQMQDKIESLGIKYPSMSPLS